ncbi:MAG: hypothetical protein JO261_14075 [Alphaproteobacteria bacterium]|nr:hypothetical protein [Alphaproteobacteria bacterium]MBV9694821.1 hypothetical protein [Alphaproteobacteria bacterium]
MPPSSDDPRDLPLAPREWLFLGLAIVFWSAFVVYLGKDTSWDFRNYHWYIPYAFLHHRLAFDVVVAHQASYYNPLIDIPFYELATHTPVWFALAALGAVQGANVVPLYLIARQSLRIDEHHLGAAALALLGQTGGLTLGLLGSHYYDNVMSLFILGGLAILIVKMRTLREGPLLHVALWTALAGFIVGMAPGLKLPEAPFAVGFGVALLFIGGDWKRQATRLAAGAIAGLAGFALFSAYWMLKMQHLTGNPLFPYFNQYFHSSLALPRAYRDLRFVPTHFWREVFFPYLFTEDWSVADDLPFRDIRVMLAYTGVIVATLLAIFRRRSKDPLFAPGAVWVLFAFAAVSYFIWLKIFAIYRYITLLEMLAPILIAAAVGLLPLPRRAQLLTLAATFFVALLLTRPDFLDRAPLEEPYVGVALPKLAHPAHSMVLMTGNSPMGFIVPEMPPQIPVLRIDGWMVQPKDGTRLTADMRARVSAFKGDLYLMADSFDMTRAHDAVADYDLMIDWPKCTLFDTNLAGEYELCPLTRKPGP